MSERLYVNVISPRTVAVKMTRTDRDDRQCEYVYLPNGILDTTCLEYYNNKQKGHIKQVDILGPENAGPDNDGLNCRGGKCMI